MRDRWRNLLRAAALAAGCGSLCCLLSFAQTALTERSGNPWFTVSRVGERVLRIEDHGADNLYLVEGSRRALLVDTGLGAADARKFVEGLTHLPLLVVNTHGHPDHAGGDYQFPEVHASERDFEIIRHYSAPEMRRLAWSNMLRGVQIPQSGLLEQPSRLQPAKLIPVQQGFVFDLGDVQLTVLEVPGHTQGSICLLDRQHRVLFTGDTNNPQVWNFLPESTTLADYLQTLVGEKRIQAEVGTLLPGHGPPLQSEFIDEQIACVRSILDGSCKDEPRMTWLGAAHFCQCRQAAVVFSAEKVK
jgi:hydroxyacylglutathione hydrolase